MQQAMPKLCECGCGGLAPIATMTSRRQGAVAGKPQRYIRGHQPKVPRPGSAHHNWKGGKTIHEEGYVFVRAPFHPRANGWGYVFEHILKAERALGRLLPPKAVVHHFNENTGDNTNSNLVICENQAYHFLLHKRARAYRKTGLAHN